MIDETPAAYKDIDAVMAAQPDLVEIVHTLKQIVCIKGLGGGRGGYTSPLPFGVIRDI